MKKNAEWTRTTKAESTQTSGSFKR